MRATRPRGVPGVVTSKTMLEALVDEPWLLLLSSCSWVSACAVRVAAVSARRSVDEASQLLLVSRLMLNTIPAGIPPSLALATCWRARSGASIADVTVVALLAAERGFIASLQELDARLERGALLELCDAYGMTPLHAAAAAGQAAVCELLCSLAAAAYGPPGWPGIVVALSRRTSKKRTVLHCAAAAGDCATLDAILAAVPSDAMQELLSASDRRQRPCALVALHEGETAAALRLVEFHKFSDDENAVASSRYRDAGAALLVYASEANDAALAAALLQRGADPNAARSSDKVTPLAAAAAHGSLGVLRHLLSRANVIVDHSEESDGRTALHLACHLGQAAAAELLVAHGANLRIEAPGGRTPLYLAAERGSLECVEVLIRAGIRAQDALCMNSRSLTPISVAQKRGNLAVSEYLLALKAATGLGRSSACSAAGAGASAFPAAKMDVGVEAQTPRTPRSPRRLLQVRQHSVPLQGLQLSSPHTPRLQTSSSVAAPSAANRTFQQRRPSPRPSSAGRPVTRASSRDPARPSVPVLRLHPPSTPRHSSPPPVPDLVIAPASTSRQACPSASSPRQSPHRRSSQPDALQRSRPSSARSPRGQSSQLATATPQQTPRMRLQCQGRPTPERARPPRMPGAVGGA